jgi:hypothetical protein
MSAPHSAQAPRPRPPLEPTRTMATEFDEQTELVRRGADVEDDETLQGRLIPAAAAIATVEAVLPARPEAPTRPLPAAVTRPLPAAAPRPTRAIWAVLALALTGGILGGAMAWMAGQ